MTPYDIGQLILCGATALMLGVTYVALRRHKHGQPTIRGEMAVMRLMAKTGPVFAWELREFGVEDPERILESLIWGGYVTSEPYPGGELYALTVAGGRRLREGR